MLLTCGARVPPFGVRAYASSDGGRTWGYERPIVIVDNCANTDCGYPTTIRLGDGMLGTIYYTVASSAPHFEGTEKTWIAGFVRYREADLLEALSR
ncbi:MAG: sialidase family protein [Planctomycetota bacterium]